MKKLALVVAVMAICGVAFGATYSITVDDKYVSYIEKRAGEENITVEQLIESRVKGETNRWISAEYNSLKESKTMDEKLVEIADIKSERAIKLLQAEEPRQEPLKETVE
jgi:hypothetical protein